MGGSGPFNFGEFHGDPDDGAHDEDDRQPVLLPPEDRLWRHPSEVSRHGHPQGLPPVTTAPGRAGRRDHRFTFVAGVVGSAAVATAVVVAVTLTSPQEVVTSAQTVSTAQEASFVTVPVTGVSAPLVVRMMAVLRPSLISIRPVGGSRSAHMTGIVLAGGDLAVTAAAGLGRATEAEIVTSTGQHRRVRVLGSDAHSGVAVVSTGGGLPAASFSEAGVLPGELAIAACLCGSAVATAAADDSPAAAVGEVRKVGMDASSGTGLVDTIEADMPLGPSPWGGVLLNGQGQVVGVLDARKGTGTGHSGVFVPAPLAIAVAQELATLHKVEHGWLGIKCADAPDHGGARITTVMTGSPAAAAGLHQGDVVEAVDTHPVDSMADLQASLYTSLPGTPVSIMLVRSGQDMTTTMTLAGTPTG